MSMANVLAYPRARMKALGYVEHDDAENFENVPRTHLSTRFQLEFDAFARDGEDQDNLEISAPFTLRFFGGIDRDAKAARDAAIVRIDTIIDDFVKASNRLTVSGLKTVVFDRGQIEPLAESNDNAFIITLEFTALVIKSTR